MRAVGVADADAASFNVSVALLQLLPSKRMNQSENIAIAEAAIRSAAAAGADISLMPELWNTGYDAAFPPYNPKDQQPTIDWLAQGAIPIDSDYIHFFISLARELSHAIVVTFLQTNPLGPNLPPLNSLTLIDATGALVLNYSKVHTVLTTGTAASGQCAHLVVCLSLSLHFTLFVLSVRLDSVGRSDVSGQRVLRVSAVDSG